MGGGTRESGCFCGAGRERSGMELWGGFGWRSPCTERQIKGRNARNSELLSIPHPCSAAQPGP